MNTQKLKDRITVQPIGYGTYKVKIMYRGKCYSYTSHNSFAYDRITGYADDVSDKTIKDFYTYKGALQALYNECKRINRL